MGALRRSAADDRRRRRQARNRPPNLREPTTRVQNNQHNLLARTARVFVVSVCAFEPRQAVLQPSPLGLRILADRDPARTCTGPGETSCLDRTISQNLRFFGEPSPRDCVFFDNEHISL